MEIQGSTSIEKQGGQKVCIDKNQFQNKQKTTHELYLNFYNRRSLAPQFHIMFRLQ